MTTLNERIGLKDLFETIIKVVFLKNILNICICCRSPSAVFSEMYVAAGDTGFTNLNIPG